MGVACGCCAGTPPVCLIAGPDLLARIAAHGAQEDRTAAIRALTMSASIRARREVVGHVVQNSAAGLAGAALSPPSGERRAVYDAQHSDTGLPGVRARGEGDPASADGAVNEAYDGAGSTYQFYREVMGREGVDGKGLEIVSSVHLGTAYDNALWNGSQMIYGDGSGSIFAVGALTKPVDVTGHELTHGVTQFTAGLRYHDQPGALNESVSDVFGSLVKQYSLGQTADQADWLIGAGILGSALSGQALRSLKAPGTANEHDQQPAEMASYVQLPADGDPANDHGGVHINSGIPNHAFYLAATAIGGNAWEKAGKVWYQVLTQQLQPTSDFAAMANATVAVAGQLFSAGGPEEQAIRRAWSQVGVL